MKMRFWIAALAALGISGNISHAGGTKAQVTAVAFYNLENFFYPEHDTGKNDYDFTPEGSYHYTWDIYKEKVHNMAYAVSQIATDVVPNGPALMGVAEIEDDKVLQDLLAAPELKERMWRFVHFEGPDIRGIDVALLYNPQLFRVLGAESLPVDIVDGGKPEYTRDVLHVKGLLSGDTVHVFVNHWPSRRGGEAASRWKREKAAAVSRRVIDSLMALNPNTKVIVMGDLNDDPVNASVAKVLNAQEDKDAVKPGGLYNPWTKLFKKGIGTLAYQDSWNLFDQIMISYGFLNEQSAGWHFYRQEIFNKSFLKSQFGQYKGYPHRSYSGTTWIDGYSDHFPTIVYFVKTMD